MNVKTISVLWSSVNMFKTNLFCAISLVFLCSCSAPKTSVWDAAKIASPDNSLWVVLKIKTKYGVKVIGPEPPPMENRSVKLEMRSGEKCIFETDYQDIGTKNDLMPGLDLQWSPDSTQIAYKVYSDFYIINKNGNCKKYNLSKNKFLIATYKWINNNELLIISKEPVNIKLGYLPIEKVVSMSISKFKIQEDKLEEIYYQKFSDMPDFLFRGIRWITDEISPDATKVAFNDDINIYIYDTITKNIVKKKLNGSIYGIWWYNPNLVIIFIDNKVFQLINIQTMEIEDITDKISMPIANEKYSSSTWFKSIDLLTKNTEYKNKK